MKATKSDHLDVHQESGVSRAFWLARERAPNQNIFIE
jgi:hypothetical protein